MIKTEKIMQITLPTPYPVGDVHLYLLKGDTLSLIDAGARTDDAWNALNEQLKTFGYTPRDIEQIILTHHHPDHTGLIDRFESLKDVYGHWRNEPWLTHDNQYFDFYLSYFERLYKEFAVPGQFASFVKTLKGTIKYGGRGELTEALQEGDTLPGHPEWKVIETPGHARSHISFYNKKDHSFIAGDHILAHISPNPLLEPPDKEGLPRPKPLLDHRQAMEKLKNYDMETVYPGHGPIFDGAHGLIDKRLAKQESRAEKLLHLIQEKPLTVYEATQKMFPTKYQSQLGLTISETVGQLDYLETVGKVSVEKQEEHLIYSIK